MARARFFFAALALAAALPLAAAEEPEAAYAQFHRALVSGNLDGMLKYGTDAQRFELAGLSPEQKAAWLTTMGALVPRSYTLRSKNLNPDGEGARLYLSGPGKVLVGGKPETMYGVAQMVMQRGEWKVASIEWSNLDRGLPAPQAAPKPLGPYAPGAPAAAAPKPAAQPAPKPAAAQKSTPQSRSTLPVGALDSAPERKFGRQKPACEFKPVMSAEDLENCR